MTRKTRKTSQQQPIDFPVTRAALYTRVSTEDQVDGYGLDVQLEKCRAQATVKGWTVVDRDFCDEGISGTKDVEDRPGLAALLDAARQRDIDAVIVLALDRLGRRTLLVLDLVERLAEMGCEVVSVKEQLDTSTPAGRFVLTMFAALAQLERDTIVQRTTDGRDARGRVDGEKGGSTPYGFRRITDDKGKATGVQVDPEKAAVVKMIFGLRQSGLTMRQIADALNDDGIAPSRGSQKASSKTTRKGSRKATTTTAQWYASSVKVVLDNRDIYAGGRRGDSPVVWPAIL